MDITITLTPSDINKLQAGGAIPVIIRGIKTDDTNIVTVQASWMSSASQSQTVGTVT